MDNQQRRKQDIARAFAALNVANACISPVARMLGYIDSDTSTTYIDPAPTLSKLQAMSRQQLMDLEQRENTSPFTDTYLRSLSKEDVIILYLKATQQIGVLEETTRITQENVAQQRLFFTGMREQLLQNGHTLVQDMTQQELLSYCIELLGGFVHG